MRAEGILCLFAGDVLFKLGEEIVTSGSTCRESSWLRNEVNFSKKLCASQVGQQVNSDVR